MKKIMALCLFLFGLTGCAVKTPLVLQYGLSATPVTTPVHTRTKQVLLVSKMKSDPGYQKNEMIYVKCSKSLRAYTYHEWVSPPAELLTSLITTQIQNTDYFKAVVMTPFVGLSDYRLDTRLIMLQQSFMQPISQVRLVIAAVLMNAKTNRVIATRRFEAVVPAPGNNPESGVAAANQAADQISRLLTRFVIQAHD